MMRRTELWTIQMAQWRLAKDLDVKFLDITAKSGLLPFAPEFSNVMAYKRGELTEKHYTDLYLAKMATSLVEFPRYWKRLEFYPRIAFACYCKAGVFCHRHLFLKLVKELLEAAGHEVIVRGELTHHSRDCIQNGQANQ